MLALMKSRRRSFTPPCNYQTCTCFCHRPETPEYKAKKAQDDAKDTLWFWVFVGSIILFFVFLAFVGGPPPKHYIRVNGRRCEVVWVQDHITSTGAGVGHEEARCPR